MPIEFPAVEEVPLAAPPLDEVVCQVRFPPILRIANEEPVEFQELIRGRFPELQKKHSFQLQLTEPGNPNPSSAESKPIIYVFANSANNAQVSLSPGFYAVSTGDYSGWNNFLEDLGLVHEMVGRTYQPAYATRIGLRYINRITTTNTGATTSEELLGLVRAELTATLRGKVWENASEMAGVVNFSAPPAQMNLRYGYEVNESVPALLLDFDYFEEGQIDLEEVLERCAAYHEFIYRAFRWTVRDEALKQFGGGTQ